MSGVAFIDTQVYVHSLCTIKNLILAADMLKSISLLRYQSDMKVLSLVSRVRIIDGNKNSTHGEQSIDGSQF